MWTVNYEAKAQLESDLNKKYGIMQQHQQPTSPGEAIERMSQVGKSSGTQQLRESKADWVANFPKDESAEESKS